MIDTRPAWRKRLEARFNDKLGVLAERIHFIPAQSAQAFNALLAAADVVLDTLHFSGGFTSFESLWAETPLVTERGNYMRGRVSAGLYDLLGLDCAITAGAEAYAARAIELAHEGTLNRAFCTQLGERKGRLLNLDDSVLPAYGRFFNDALETAEHNRSERMAS